MQPADICIVIQAIFIVYSWLASYIFSIEYDNYQISGGGKSGKLLIDRDGVWRPICYTGYGFTDNLADTACVNIGYQRSTDVYPYTLAYVLCINDIIYIIMQVAIAVMKYM